MKDQDMMTDVLNSQKSITGNYNTFANEVKDCHVKDTLMDILYDEHSIQFDVFRVMDQRGWYETENALPDKINKVKQKFPVGCPDCN